MTQYPVIKRPKPSESEGNESLLGGPDQGFTSVIHEEPTRPTDGKMWRGLVLGTPLLTTTPKTTGVSLLLHDLRRIVPTEVKDDVIVMVVTSTVWEGTVKCEFIGFWR